MESFFSHPILFGEEFLNNVHLFVGAWLDWIMAVITNMGDKYFYAFLLIIVYWCRDRKTSVKMALIILGSAVLNESAKLFFHNPRPDAAVLAPGIDRLSRLFRPHDSFGFPSGHTQLAFTYWITAKYYYKKKPVLLPGIILSLLVAYSRLYLGVHYLGDVLGGFLLCLLTLPFLLLLMRHSTGHLTGLPELPLVIPTIILPIVPLFFITGTSLAQILGVSSGFTAGVLLARRYIRYNPENKMMANIIKVVSGMVVALLIYGGLKIILPKNHFLLFITTWLSGFWLAFGAPWLFTKIHYLRGTQVTRNTPH